MLKVSYGEQDITPDHPVDLCGFALRKGTGGKVFDPLKVRWLSLGDDSGPQALLGSADLISLSRGTYQALRNEIRKSTGAAHLPIGLATTHTHSGPVTVKLRYCGSMDRAYLSAMKARVVQSATKAFTKLPTAARIVVGRGECRVNVNRRHGEAGPVDHEVLVTGFLDPKTYKPVATIVNFSCHPVVLGHLSNAVSADYPGYLSALMEAETGAPCLYLNGACGDVNPRNDKSVDPGEARKTGEAVARAALKALKSAKPVAGSGIGWHTQPVKLPVRQPKSAADFTKRLTELEKTFALPPSMFQDRVNRNIRLLDEGKYPKHIAIELSLMTLGDDLGILFIPGEVFTSIGLRIKDMARSRTLMISAFSNGSVGYIPDRQAYTDGGYEPHYANFFYDFPELDPSVEDVVLKATEHLLARVR